MEACFAFPIDHPSSSLQVKDPLGYSDVVDNIMVVVTKVVTNIFRSNIDVADPCYKLFHSVMQALTSDLFDWAQPESLQTHCLT